MSSDMKAVYEANLPPGAIWRPRSGGDFDHLLDGMGDNAQVVFDFLATLADIRNPDHTTILDDLEKEFGIITNDLLPESERRNTLKIAKYETPNTASWEHLQDKLRALGFTGIVVTPNDPAVDPTLITGELLVNGTLLVSQAIGYTAQAAGQYMFAGNSRAVAGYYTKNHQTPATYAIPPERDFWSLIFFVGGVASGWPGAPAIATYDLDYKREQEIKRLILQKKPVHSWAVLVLNFIMIWEHQTPDASYSGTFRTATGGNGLHIMAGTGGAIQTSVDGVNWVAQTPDGGYSGTFYGSAFDGSTFVLVGTSGEIQSSVDGVNWVAQTPAGGYSGDFRTATWGNGQFVIAGASGEIQTSQDGVSWSSQAPAGGFSGFFFGSAWGVDKFCLVGSTGGEIQTSVDGVNWVQQTQAGGAGAFNAVTYGNGLFVAVNNGAVIQTSPDGIVWQNQTAAGGYAGSWNAITYGNSRFVAVGSGAEIQSSVDGINWVEETCDPPFSGTFMAADFYNSLFVIGGTGGEIQTS